MSYFQVISDLVHDFMNSNALKITERFIKKIKKDPGLYSHKGIFLWPSTYMQDEKIPAIVNEKIVIKC